ncbi:hypothetical protein [Ruminococcus sp. NK3A76]|uniref:hypothetical protein n=1 Tax=Ruminococcus sp. NK3A76 TaxID=877411 RepID=UPI00048D79B5|nr:hypothetical protein [Ruminococcus sp. NK3A76]
MANQIIREELKAKGVRQWQLAAALGISEQTMVRRLRFELDEETQLEMLTKIEELTKRKEEALEFTRKE